MYMDLDESVKDVGKDNFKVFFESMRHSHRYHSLRNTNSVDFLRKTCNFKMQLSKKMEKTFTINLWSLKFKNWINS